MAKKQSKNSKKVKTLKTNNLIRQNPEKTEIKPEQKHTLSEAKSTIEKQSSRKNSLDNLKKAKGFDKNPQNINKKGRPRILVSHVIEQMKKNGVQPLKASQIVEAYETLMNLTIPELTEHISNPNIPVFVRIIGKAMLSNKGTEMIERMMDRAHGKAKQSVDMDLNLQDNTLQITRKVITQKDAE